MPCSNGCSARPHARIPPARTPRRHRYGPSIDRYLQTIIAPYISPAPDPQLPQLLSAVDAALADAMRALLHDAAFQRLEAMWRGVHWLLTTIGDRDEPVVSRSLLLHVTRDELAADGRLDAVLARDLDGAAAGDQPSIAHRL